ncbi:MAG: hypothetical protein WCZ23_09690 [Rhodospirillaceae bacterium]
MTKVSRALLVLIAAAAPVLTAACEPQDRATLHPSFGNAVQHNMAMHVVNPNPARVDVPPDYSGQRTAIALGRYNTDTVKEVEAISTRSEIE